MGNIHYWQKKMSKYQTRMAQQMAKYGTEVQEFMKGEKAGKSWEDIFDNKSRNSENRGWKKEQQEGSKTGAGDDRKKETSLEIHHKIERLPSGSMIGMHRIAHLEENEQDKVLLSLIVSKGARKFS